MQYMKEVHQKVIDTLHPYNNYSKKSFYKVFVIQKSDALLMDEQSMNFFEHQLRILP